MKDGLEIRRTRGKKIQEKLSDGEKNVIAQRNAGQEELRWLAKVLGKHNGKKKS